LESIIGNDRKKHKFIHELATISDEAFALLVLENIWDEWKDMNVVEFFSRHKGIEKGTKRKKLVEDVGQVMQMEVQNMVGGMLRE